MAGEIVYVEMTVIDGRNRTSTISIPFKLDALSTVGSLVALTKRVTDIVGKLTTAGLKKASVCLAVDVTGFWDNSDALADGVTFGDVQEKGHFNFLTQPDAIGVQRAFTRSIPAVNDDVVFIDGQNAIDVDDPDVADFISMITNGLADLTSTGGGAGDVVSAVDSRGLDIASFSDGYQTWGNRRK